MPLNKEQITLLLELLEIEIIAEQNGYIFAKRARGYSADKKRGAIQAALSIMLHVSQR